VARERGGKPGPLIKSEGSTRGAAAKRKELATSFAGSILCSGACGGSLGVSGRHASLGEEGCYLGGESVPSRRGTRTTASTRRLYHLGKCCLLLRFAVDGDSKRLKKSTDEKGAKEKKVRKVWGAATSTRAWAGAVGAVFPFPNGAPDGNLSPNKRRN